MGPEDLWLIKYTPLMSRKLPAISMPQKSWMCRRSGVRGTSTPLGMLWGPKMSSDMATVQSHGMIVCRNVCFILHIPIYLPIELAGWLAVYVCGYCVREHMCVCIYGWVFVSMCVRECVYVSNSHWIHSVYILQYIWTAQFPHLFIQHFLLWFWLFDSISTKSTLKKIVY